MIKKINAALLAILMIILPVYLLASFYFLDKHFFFCPIKYSNGIAIRSDSRGDGLFASSRNGRRLHEGLDLYARVGTPVFASCFGRVVSARQNRGMGKYIIIRHPGNMLTVYGHLSRMYVRKGDFIRQGQLIASVGKTGNANHPRIQSHLHFEVRKNGVPQDPLEYL